MPGNTITQNEVIADTPFPTDDPSSTTISAGGNQTVSSNPIISDNTFPIQKIAVDLISSNLNTKTQKIISAFSFSPTGAIEIGDFEEGVSGDIRISPDGFIARNIAGDTTVAIDGDTGDATFAGDLRGARIIGDAVVVGDDSIQIDGDAKRIVFFDDTGLPSIIIGQV